MVAAAVWSLHRRIDTRVRQTLGQAPSRPRRDRMRPWSAKAPCRPDTLGSKPPAETAVTPSGKPSEHRPITINPNR
jgi:hypothetical protein